MNRLVGNSSSADETGSDVDVVRSTPCKHPKGDYIGEFEDSMKRFCTIVRDSEESRTFMQWGNLTLARGKMAHEASQR